MEDYICQIADVNLIHQKWDEEIAKHQHSLQWIEFKKNALQNLQTRCVYMGILNGHIITEATAIFEQDPNIQNKEGLVGKHTAYLCAFRTNKEYEGQGYFSKLYKFMENDLKGKGFRELTLGVEPCEVRNMQIYFKWGYQTFIKTAYEIYPPEKPNSEPEKILVNYYLKHL